MSNNYQGAAPDAMSQLKQGLPLALLLSGVVLVVGVIGFFVYSWMTGVGDLGPIRPTAATETREEQVDDVAALMESARTAMREDRMVQPAGNNAVELYLNVLEREPENRAAREALTELIPIAMGPAERLVETGDFVEGERVLSLLQRADEGSVLVSALRQKLGLAQRAAEQNRLAEERARLQRENATAARNEPAPAPTPAPAAPTLSSADINPLASNPAVAASRATPPATTPAPTTPPPAETRPATPEPTVASVTPPRPASSPQDRNFELIRRVNPTYPQRALRERVQGWVEIEFTITPSGDVENVSVVNAQPKRGDFDREAIRAVQQWKFRPKIENGRPVSATVKQRLNFTLGG